MSTPPIDRGPYRAERSLAAVIPPDHRRRNAIILAVVSACVGAAGWAALERLWALHRCPHDAGSASSFRSRRVAARGLLLSRPGEDRTEAAHADRTSRRDGPILPDGQPDESFAVSADGPFVSLLLLSTDASGRAMGGQQWDTIVGNVAVPRGARSSFGVGASTWQLGVTENGAPCNASDGSLLPMSEGHHTLRIHASNSGWFTNGRYFRLYGELADGTFVESNVLEYIGAPTSNPRP